MNPIPGLRARAFALAIPVLASLLISQTFTAQALAEDKVNYLDVYDSVLKKHVNPEGLVNYQALQASRAELDSFNNYLATTSSETYDSWSRDTKLAFWLNAYNSLTLKAVIDAYPIKAIGVNRFVHPKNSIRQIPGVWKGENHTVLGKKVSLDSIEHKIIRVEFPDWRIHMALVCAAVSCPPLRAEAYRGERLDSQLDDQTKTFISNERNFSIKENSLFLSAIFKWFSEDFPTSAVSNFPQISNEKERRVADTLFTFSKKNNLSFDWGQVKSLKFFKYNWELNDQKVYARN